MRAVVQPDLEPVWRALASPVRREILDALHESPRTTGALAERFRGLSRFAVMQHLEVLERAGLVLSSREGRTRVNTINPVPIRQIYERWVSKFDEAWAKSLTDLKRAAEAGGAGERSDA